MLRLANKEQRVLHAIPHVELERISAAVVVGAGHGIGLSLVKALLSLPQQPLVFATYRQLAKASELVALQAIAVERLNLHVLDAKVETHFQDLAILIAQKTERVDVIINCVGYLYDDAHQPEKRLAELDYQHLLDSFRVNSMPVALLAKHLFPLVKNPNPAIFASLSARVGSIGDNRSGGWYSYRASKSAHNMLLKNISLEFARFKCNTLTLALHPGTTDTELSKPFASRTKYQLHHPDQTAANLLGLLHKRSLADTGRFFDWQGAEVEW